MNLNVDLHLAGNDFSNVATFMFVALLLFEIPNSKFRPFLGTTPPLRSWNETRNQKMPLLFLPLILTTSSCSVSAAKGSCGQVARW